MTASARLLRAAPYAVVLVLAAVFFVLAGQIEYVGPAERIGPQFWPRAVLLLLGLTCAYELAKSLLARGSASAGGMLQSLMESAHETLEPEAGAAAPSLARLGLGMGATLAYVLLIQDLGFFVATAAYLTAFIAIGGYRRWGIAVTCGLAGSLLMVVLFMKLVYVSLPLGTGPFQSLSVALLALLGVR